MIILLDTGGVEAVAPIDEQRRARLRLRLLDVVSITDVDEVIGYAAGALRQEAIRAGLDPAPSGVDAIVAAEADARAAGEDVRILTTDGGDFELLASLGANAARLSVLVV